MATTHGPQDYRCPACSYELKDHRAWWQPIPEEEREYSWETERKVDPTCPNCHAAMEWVPVAAQHDLLPEGFIVTELDGGPFRPSSLHEIRQIERESERRAANGEGSPIGFRDFSQNHSNRARNMFEGTSYQRSKSERIRPQTQSGQRIRGGAYRGE
jgi:hypothetical protein